MKSILCFFTLFLALFDFSIADSYFFPNNSFSPDNNVSAACAGAMQGALPACLPDILTYMWDDNFTPITSNQTYKSSLCNATCGTQFKNYVANVTTNCANQVQPYNGLPANWFGSFAWSTYNTTCLQDSTGMYCNDYIYNITANVTTDTTLSALPASQVCVPCVYKFYQQIQGTPYSNYGPALASDFAALQTKCGVSYPTAVPSPVTNVTNIPGYAPANSSFSGYCISGNTYTVQSGDTCEAIAEKHNVATGTLIAINGLLPDGSDLQGGQSLCLPMTCTTYIVQSGDNCSAIMNHYNLTYPQFRGYNPNINSYCTNLIAQRTYCVSPPGQAWNGTTVAGATGTQTAVYATSTVAAPGPTAHGTTPDCGEYYLVNSGDFCQNVALNQSIQLSLFEQINPSINANCSNLVPNLYYCVQPTQNWNATNATNTNTVVVPPPTQTPTGTTADCYEWYTIKSGDYCALIESSFNITFAQFQLWNPSLNSGCTNLYLGEAYCVSSPVNSTTTASSTASPQNNAVSTTTGSGSASAGSSSVPKSTSAAATVSSTASARASSASTKASSVAAQASKRAEAEHVRVAIDGSHPGVARGLPPKFPGQFKHYDVAHGHKKDEL